MAERNDEPLVTLTGKGVASLIAGVVALILGVGALLTTFVMPMFLEKADERFRAELDRRMAIHENRIAIHENRLHVGAASEAYVDRRMSELLSRLDVLGNVMATKVDVEALKVSVAHLTKEIDKLDGK